MYSKQKAGNVCRVCIVKRKGWQEEFDEKKVYGSVYASSLTGGLKKKEAEKLAEKIAKQVKTWADRKKSIQSKQISGLVTKLLNKENKEIAFLYKTHMDIS